MERVVLIVTISLKGGGYNYSAGLSRLRELLQWIRYAIIFLVNGLCYKLPTIKDQPFLHFAPSQNAALLQQQQKL